MMRIMSKLLCVAALAASVAFPADASSGDVFDGLSVWLDFRGDGPSAGGGAVGNLLDATAGSPLGGSHETNRAALVSVEVVPPALPWETNVVKALRLPQCFDAETGKIMPVALDLPQAAVDAAVQTAYVRFRWDGAPNPSKAYSEWLILNGYSWGAESGWGLGVSNVANADPARGNLCCMVPQKTMVFSWNDGFSLSPGVWYDLFVQLSPSEDETKTVFSFFLLKEPSKTIVDREMRFRRIPPRETYRGVADANDQRRGHPARSRDRQDPFDSAGPFRWRGCADGGVGQRRTARNI